MVRTKGFTLIELLVASSILGILFTIGMSQYITFNRSRLFAETVKNIKSTLVTARSRALAGEKGCNGTVANPYDGWMVDISTSQYEIYSTCVGDSTKYAGSTYKLPGSIQLSGSDIHFLPFWGTESSGSITVAWTGVGSQVINVNLYGNIE